MKIFITRFWGKCKYFSPIKLDCSRKLALSLNSCGSTRTFAHGENETLPMGSLCSVCDLYSHSETAHGKSLWIHQKEQKNYPWHFPNQVVGFSLRLSNYKSSLTNRVEEKSKPGNCSTCSTCWAHFCGVALKLRRGTYQIQYTWHQTWLTFEVHSECILLVFTVNTH